MRRADSMKCGFLKQLEDHDVRKMRHRPPGALPNLGVVTIGLAGLALTVSLCVQARASAQQPARQVGATPSSPSTGAVPPVSSHRGVIDRYCVTCHNQTLKTAGVMLDEANVANPGAGAEVWEKVVRKLRTSTMPPPNMPQPSIEERGALLSWLETSLDAAAAAKPNPGRTETLRRLNRYRVSKRHQRPAFPRHRRRIAAARR